MTKPAEAGAREPGWIIWCFLAYFALHAGVRLLLPEGLELDEAEQVVLAQDFRWNYGVQHPPLYTWVQLAAFSLVGTGVLGLALVKNLFLFLTFWFLYRAGCEATGRWTLGLVTAASTFFIPQFMWEVYRDLTHSVAASACAAATIWLVLRLRRQPNAWGYASLGLVAAVGALSKINYLVLLGAAAIASVLVPSFRTVILNRRILITLACFAILFAYPAWMAASEAGTGLPERRAGPPAWWRGPLSLLWATPAFVLPGVVIYLVVRAWGWRGSKSEETQWLGWMMLLGVLGCLVSAFFNGMYFKDRHLMPILIALPIWLVCRSRENLTPQRTRRIEALALALAGGVLIALPASTWISSKAGDPNRRAAPFAALASAIRERMGQPAVIVAENRWFGANLLMEFPESVVEVPEASLGLAKPGGTWIVVWDLDRRPQPSPAQAALTERLSGRVWQWEPHDTVSAPYLYSQAKSLRLAVVVGDGQPPGN